jgi:GNAT superfamily N-acetyltransferase
MVPADKDALREFFLKVPEADRLYLKDDVTAPGVIERWAETLDYDRVLPLLGIRDDKIIADGTLHRKRAPLRKHVGEVRLVVDPEYRNLGVGRALLRQLIALAKRDGVLERLNFELVADTEKAAIHTAQILGFVPVAIFPSHVRYVTGEPHDLIIMELRLSDFTANVELEEPDPYYFY